jgi:hypothetical protein
MNKITSGLCAVVLITGMAGCNLFKKSSHKQANVPQIDSAATIAVTDSAGNPVTDATVLVPRASDSMNAFVDSMVKADAGQQATLSPEKQQLITGLLPLWNSRLEYNTFSGKAKVRLESPKDKQDFTATIRMEKDKKIWISIVALGVFEAARVLITPDSIFVVDRLHKDVMIRSFKDAGKLLPVAVEFSTLQGLLIGDALHASADMPTDATAFGGGISLDVHTNEYQQQLTYNKADSSIRQQQLRVGSDSAKGTLLLMQYGNYSVVDNRRFSSERTINVQDTTGQTHIEMQFNRAEFDKELEYPFSVPSKYTRK